jgi:hypothetical protein
LQRSLSACFRLRAEVSTAAAAAGEDDEDERTGVDDDATDDEETDENAICEEAGEILEDADEVSLPFKIGFLLSAAHTLDVSARKS